MGALSLNTVTWGAGGSRRILLLHGITSSVAGWWRVGPDLATEGWEVVAVDLRGHGDSPKLGSYLFSEHVEDVLAVGTGWDAVLGHSMGGTIAVLAATARPDWADGLILQDPALMIPEPKSEALGWLLQEYDLGLDVDRIAAANPGWHRNDVVAKVEALEKSGADVVRQTVESNWPWMALDEAAGLTMPTILLGSDPEAGGILPVTIGEWLASSPLLEYEVIPGASHSTHRDDDRYETYRMALVGALDRLPTLGG